MSAQTFQFVVTDGKKRQERKIVAHSTREAACTGIRTCEPMNGPIKISCKPMRVTP